MKGELIFLLPEKGEPLELRQQPYDSEELLQKLLADYPHLLPGTQIDQASPRRWLLVTREMDVPFEDMNRWAIDHLFLDQDGIPTLVEVKRSSDTRIRREVVGQMLDYAANAIVYWPLEKIQAAFEATCQQQAREPADALSELLGPTGDHADFWRRVKTNLQAGRVRLLFVADVIPPELARIVEFLNKQMDPAEVLAVEIGQYVGSGERALVPRVIGQTQLKSGATIGVEWTESRFMEALAAKDASLVPVARALVDSAHRSQLRIAWGRGVQWGSFSLICDHRDSAHTIASVWTGGTIQIEFLRLKVRPPFEDEAARMELLRRLTRIPGIHLKPDSIHGEPGIRLEKLKSPPVLEQFREVLAWVVERIRQS